MDIEMGHELKIKSAFLSHKTAVDWRGRSCKPNKHGGLRAAVFVLGLSLSSFLSHFVLEFDEWFLEKKNSNLV